MKALLLFADSRASSCLVCHCMQANATSTDGKDANGGLRNTWLERQVASSFKTQDVPVRSL